MLSCGTTFSDFIIVSVLVWRLIGGEGVTPDREGNGGGGVAPEYIILIVGFGGVAKLSLARGGRGGGEVLNVRVG